MIRYFPSAKTWWAGSLLLLMCLVPDQARSQVKAFAVGPIAAVDTFRVPFDTVRGPRVTFDSVRTAPCARGFSEPLPLATDLDAERTDGRTVLLRWRVEESPTPYAWTLERRFEVTARFTPRHALPDALLRREEYTDRNAYPGTTYYRLRGVAPDGAEVFSNIRSVDNPFGRPGLSIFPNPVRTSGTVQVPTTELAFDLLLTDQLGRTAWRAHYAAGVSNPLTIDLPAVPPGLYLLRWVVEDATGATVRVVIGK